MYVENKTRIVVLMSLSINFVCLYVCVCVCAIMRAMRLGP